MTRRPFNGNYFMLIFLVIMILNAIRSPHYSSIGEWIIDTLLKLPAIVIGITIHEYAHARTAWKLGDMTPKAQGRVTLNPAKHIDPFGIIALIFVGFGWGRPVQVNPYAFRKNRRLANLLVDVAGVLTNLVVAFLCTALLFVVSNGVLSAILYYIVWFNIVLMIFNLLPVPPLDGFGILTEIFDLRRRSWYDALYNYGPIILLVLIITGATGKILGTALISIFTAFTHVWALIL
ncbi:MAG: site-2 protease family protein [Clostridiales bacterium]|nr:site-2 protease family protein [Clostridiales bacterium]